MFNGMLKSDDVEVYEIGSVPLNISLSSDCKNNLVFNSFTNSAYVNLPNNAHIGKQINFTVFEQVNGTGKGPAGSLVYIQHSNTNLFTLRQGTVSFMYVGQQLNGLTATDKSKSGWIILGGVQGDTAITGYAGSIAIGSGAYCNSTNSVAIGSGANATGNSVALGTSATNSSSTNAIAIGNLSLTNGTYSIAIGDTASCYIANAVVIGRQAYSNVTRIALKSNYQFSTSGDAQAGKFILMRQTTDATPLVISATNAAASTSNILILPNNGTYAFKGIVVAKDASTLDSAMWEVTALMKRGANASTTALVGTPTVTKVFNDAGAAAWTIALTADTTNGGGAITVTGEAGKTIRWVSNIDSAELI